MYHIKLCDCLFLKYKNKNWKSNLELWMMKEPKESKGPKYIFMVHYCLILQDFYHFWLFDK